MTPHRIGRLHHVIMDCPDPAALAMFYAELLGLPITWQEDSRSTLTSWSMTSKRPEGTSGPWCSAAAERRWQLTDRRRSGRASFLPDTPAALGSASERLARIGLAALTMLVLTVAAWLEGLCRSCQMTPSRFSPAA